MSITRLEIRNFKSITKMELEVNSINCLIGTNNVGKSSIIKALYFYFCNLTDELYDDTIFNKLNPFTRGVEICVHYDVNILQADDALQEYDTNEAENIKNLLKEYVTSDGILLVRLRKQRLGKSTWNIPYKLRSLVKKRFPIFFIESRSINLYEWDALWQVVRLINPIRQKISNDITSIFDENTKEILSILKEVFLENDIKIDNTNVYEKIELLVQLHFGGKKFDTQNNSLSLDSFGKNSYSYIKIFIDIILRLYETKRLSVPLIMIDEPELHLHPQAIEKMAKSAFDPDVDLSKVKWFISTHSANLVKNIVILRPDAQVLHLSKDNLSPQVSRIRDFRRNKSVQFMSDREANLFFSEACIFVEGETEVELFANRNITKLYPVLKKYTIYNYDSKLDKLMLVHPRAKNYPAIYKVLLDMDKVIDYTKKKKFNLIKKEKELNILVNKPIIERQKYYYKDKYDMSYKLRKNIETSLNINTFTLNQDGLNIVEELNYRKLIEDIQKYFLQYNTYPVSTTIEGVIINESNVDIFFDWLKTKVYNLNLLNNIVSNLTNSKSKVTFFRILFMGKNDALKKVEIFNRRNMDDIRRDLMKKPGEQSQAEFFKKTSGWITNYINWFFQNNISNFDAVNRKCFSTYFPELAKILKFL